MKNKKNIVVVCLMILLLSCTNAYETKDCMGIKSVEYVNHKSNNDYNKIDSLAQFYYKQFFTSTLSYDDGRDLSNEVYRYLDSTLKYLNALMIYDSTDYNIHFRIISVYSLKEDYKSILDYIDLLPQYEWPPYYKEYLKFKCKALIATQNNDTIGYNICLDSIIILWTPEFRKIESICDSILGYQYMDYVFDENYSPKLLLYEKYYEIFRFRYGKNFMKQILNKKKQTYKWTTESYDIICRRILGADLIVI